MKSPILNSKARPKRTCRVIWNTLTATEHSSESQTKEEMTMRNSQSLTKAATRPKTSNMFSNMRYNPMKYLNQTKSGDSVIWSQLKAVTRPKTSTMFSNERNSTMKYLNQTKSSDSVIWSQVSLLPLAAIALAFLFPLTALAEKCDLNLTNGKIHTMDKNNRIVSSVFIRDGKVHSVNNSSPSSNNCINSIDLKGKTVIPGLIDNHNHFIRYINKPGHEARQIENAFSIQEAKDVIRDRAEKVNLTNPDKDEFITVIEGFRTSHFIGEDRLPTLDELDEAVDFGENLEDRRPVFMQPRRTFVAITNTAGKKIFEDAGIPVSDGTGTNPPEGTISGRPNVTAALNLLSTRWDSDAKKEQSVLNAVKTFNSRGVVMLHMTQEVKEGGNTPLETSYNAFLRLAELDKINIRTRLYFITATVDELLAAIDEDGDFPDGPDYDGVLVNFPQFPASGPEKGDLIKSMGIGELGFLVIPPTSQPYQDIIEILADERIQLMSHNTFDGPVSTTLNLWEALEPSINGLRWSSDHNFSISTSNMDRLVALGASARLATTARFSPNPSESIFGPPYRTLLDHGINVGAHSDGAKNNMFNPWLGIYYMVTGREVTGLLVNAPPTSPTDERISRKEAIELWTSRNAWFSFEEDKTGTLEQGKFADIVVLSDDFFDENKVTDEKIKDIKSVLTIVDGKCVYDAEVLNVPSDCK